VEIQTLFQTHPGRILNRLKSTFQNAILISGSKEVCSQRAKSQLLGLYQFVHDKTRKTDEGGRNA
jgi:hypothetical protein